MDIILKVETWKINGTAFRQLRKFRNFTIKDISLSSGLSSQFICDVEHGRRCAFGDTANKLLKAVKSKYRITTTARATKQKG